MKPTRPTLKLEIECYASDIVGLRRTLLAICSRRMDSVGDTDFYMFENGNAFYYDLTTTKEDDWIFNQDSYPPPSSQIK